MKKQIKNEEKYIDEACDGVCFNDDSRLYYK